MCECRSNNSSRNPELESFQLPDSIPSLSSLFFAAHSSAGLFLFSSPWENRIHFVFQAPLRAAC